MPRTFTRPSSSPTRPTSPLRLALSGTVALVAALGLSSATHADVVIDSPDGFVIRSGGSTTVGGASLIEGSLGAGGAFDLGWGSKITGVIEKGSPHTWLSPTIGDMPPWGKVSINLDWREKASLAPGAYAGFSSNSETTLLLSAGEYVFSKFQLGWAGVVMADTSGGDVYLYIGDSLSAGANTRFVTNGGGSLYIIAGGSASFDFRSEIEGLLYTKGSQNFGSETRLTGLTWSAGSISVGYGSTFEYSAPIPTPAALALLGLTGVLLRRRRS
ncbi:MAG: hypothetical protein KF724_10500 [Phycisphaeraceae bacterium]|nr:hypothetical protein [Phycisphaeraceae bacterium]